MPPVSDRDLYCSFFKYVQGVSNAIEHNNAANPNGTANLQQRLASQLQVDVKELPTVLANIQQITQDYDKLDNDRGKGNFDLPKGAPKPTSAQMNSMYEFRKTQLTLRGTVTLWQQLTPASWNGLHGYIESTYKQTIYKPQH